MKNLLLFGIVICCFLSCESYAKSKCPQNKPIQTMDGMCISCNEVNGDLINCSACPNTMVSWNGGCYPCSTNAVIFSQEECKKCSETRWFDGKYCIPKKSNKEGFPFVRLEENCCDLPDEEAHFVVYEDCDTRHIIKTDRKTCDLCPNRVFTGNYCVLKDEPLEIACDGLKKSVFVPKEVCDLCPNRKYMDEKCILKEGPKGMFADIVGDYYPCYMDRSLGRGRVSEKECSKCANRKYIDEECVLNF